MRGLCIFAWFQTAAASVALQTTDNTATLETTATTAADDVEVDVILTINLLDPLEPTLESDGKTYVVRNGVVEEPSSQPAAGKRYSNNNAVTITGLVYHADNTKALGEEDARSLKNAIYKINLKGGNGNPGLRIDNTVTSGVEQDNTIDRIVNDENGVDIGSVVFDGTSPKDTWVLKATLDGTGSVVSALEDKFYYAYNPQYAGAAGVSQDSEEATSAAQSVTVIATLTPVSGS